MKKVLTFIWVVCLGVISGLVLTACDSPSGEPPHTHAFTETVATENFLKSDKTCVSKAVYYKSCSCGEKGTETFESGELGEHSYGGWTSNNDGTHTKTCANDSTHTVTENCSGGTANCTTLAVCTDCSVAYGTYGDHSYGGWTSNNDGTHTKTCANDNTHTVTENCSGGTANCTTLAVCTDCSVAYGNYGKHVFSEEWTVSDGKHWHACQNSQCQEKSEEGDHVYKGGVCVCGDEADIPEIYALTQTQWENAFALENVTVKQYEVKDGQNVLVGTILIDGEDVVMDMMGMQIPMEGFADATRESVDFSDFYSTAEYRNGKYFVLYFDVYGDESYIYENVYLTFENGVLISVSATVIQEIPEYDDDYNVIGTAKETLEVYIEFVDYGTTDLTIERDFPLTETEWEAIFAPENFNNMTITVNFEIDSVNYRENIYYNNGEEKITVDGYDGIELYCVDSVWYTYDAIGGTFAETDVFGDEYPFVTLSDSIKEYFLMLKDIYMLMNYDSTNDIYYFSDEENQNSFYLTIEDGKITSFTNVFLIEEEASVYSYTLTNYGTTSFTVPFTPAVS